MPDIRQAIQSALAAFESAPLRECAIRLLSTLGYSSDRTLNLGSSSPRTFLDLVRSQVPDSQFNEPKALSEAWKSADLLFQVTDDELANSQSLFHETDIKPGLLRSYIFFAIELTGEGYARGKLTGIARQINRVFPMPVMVLIKHVTDKKPVLSIAVINRRQSKRDALKDVLGKVTIIRDISLLTPHRGHLDILASFARPNLVHPQRLPINNFDTLHAAWEEIFNVELLNKRFYRELANWYFWALPQVEFPADTEKDHEKRRATSLIRLLTRLIFCWFLKEKGLVPEKLFNEADLTNILVDLSPESCTYHQAILQNLFFATLNQRMGKDKNGQPFRAFARDEGFQKNRATYGVDTLYRYEEHFREPANALEHFADVPLLNGGLFECLDRTEEGTDKKLYLDGFSRNKKKRPVVPNRLFFARTQKVDLSDAYGEPKKKNEEARGLLRILHSYKFTIVENTPIDQEIALDPELLGKVFENLLASYNEETKTTARKQTGSFYTPRPIVEYMVDESLKAHLLGVLTNTGMTEKDAQTGLEILFAYTEREHPFKEREISTLLEAIHTCKILDPACGSGAFPMGMLQKLVYIIHKLDPDNAKWMQLQIDTASKIPDPSSRDAAIAAIERDFADNEDDYGRKLYLIENCLYGVDIQPIAIQISKLRFFISLICDQRTSRNKKENHGIRPLPNLETKFVAADTLVGLPEIDQMALVDPRVYKTEAEIESHYHSHFSVQRRDQKLSLQRKVRELRKELGKILAESLGSSKKAEHIAAWDAFDPQATSDFFDPHWMFGRSLTEGFEIVLGNPPYVTFRGKEKIDVSDEYVKQLISTYPESAEYKINSYALFIDRSLRVLKKGGMLSFIIPSTLLQNENLERTRRLILKGHHLARLLIFEAKVFEAITDSIVIFVSKAKDNSRTEVITSDAPDYSDLGAKSAVFDQKSWLNGQAAIINTRISKGQVQIIDEIERNSTPLGELLNVYVGIVASGMKQFLSTEPLNKNYKKYLQGRDLSRFKISPRKLFINFDKERLHSNTDESVYLQDEKLLVRKTGNFLLACYDDEQFYTDQSIYNLYAPPGRKTPVKTLLCFLNSSVLNFYFRKKMITNPDVFPYIKGIHLKQLPIKQFSPKEATAFDLMANIIHFAKKHSEQSLANFFDDLIDACAIECYFREHTAQRDLLFLEELAPHLANYDPSAAEPKQRDFLAHLHRTLNAPSSKIRNRLLRLTADSPDLLAVIKAEGKA